MKRRVYSVCTPAQEWDLLGNSRRSFPSIGVMPLRAPQFALWLLAASLLLQLPAAAQEIGTVTLVEGSLGMIRGTAVLRAGEGVRLRQGDIIESSSGGFAQLELAGGTIMALGPSTRVLLLGRGAKTATELVMLNGWLKGETGPNAGTYCYASPQLAATARAGGVVVLQASVDKADIFVESGSAGISKVSLQGSLANPEGAKAGQFFTRRGGRDIIINSRPDQAFIDAIPHAFRDTLPSRLSRFPKGVDPKPDHEVTYAEIQPWLTMGQSWRRGFVARFQPRLRDPDFRKAVEAHLNDHPEWDSALHPENDRTKTTPAAVESPDAERRR